MATRKQQDAQLVGRATKETDPKETRNRLVDAVKHGSPELLNAIEQASLEATYRNS